MSNTLKIGISVSAVILAGLGIWWYLMQPASPAVTTVGTNSSTGSTVSSSTTSNSGSPTQVNGGTSDASLAQDATYIDLQMSGLTADTASTDKGLASQ